MLRFTPAQRVHAVCAFVVPIVLVLMVAWSAPRAVVDPDDACVSQTTVPGDPVLAQQDCLEAQRAGVRL